MTATTFVTIELVEMRCGECGVVFAVDKEHRKKLIDTHQAWYCPNGHCRAFNGRSEAEQLRDQLVRQRAETDQAWACAQQATDEKRQVERRLRGTKAVVTRMKRRAIAGRCPCCSHQFKDLERHMKTQHPKFDPSRAADALAEKTEAR